MALNFTQDQIDAYDKQVETVDAEAILPDPADVAAGLAGPGDVEFIEESGLENDIINANKAIDDNLAKIPVLQDEQDMQQVFIDHYSNFLRNYENEIKFIDGSYEAQPWQTWEVSEPNNIFYGLKLDYGSQTGSRYFPDGTTTIPLEAQAFPEETYSATKLTDGPKYTDEFEALVLLIDLHVSNWTDLERQAGAPDPVFPVNLPQDILNQQQFDDEKQDIINQLDIVKPLTGNLVAFYSLFDEVTTFYDDENAGAVSTKQAYEAKMITLNNMLIALPYNADPTLINYPDSVLVDYNTQKPIVTPDAAARLAEIPNYNLPAHYEVRRVFAIEMADMGEGIIYKKLSAVANDAQLVSRRDKLVRKKAVYDSVNVS